MSQPHSQPSACGRRAPVLSGSEREEEEAQRLKGLGPWLGLGMHA